MQTKTKIIQNSLDLNQINTKLDFFLFNNNLIYVLESSKKNNKINILCHNVFKFCLIKIY